MPLVQYEGTPIGRFTNASANALHNTADALVQAPVRGLTHGALNTGRYFMSRPLKKGQLLHQWKSSDDGGKNKTEVCDENGSCTNEDVGINFNQHFTGWVSPSQLKARIGTGGKRKSKKSRKSTKKSKKTKKTKKTKTRRSKK